MFTFPLLWGDPDVTAHLSRITTSNPTLISALENLILGAKSNNLWNKILTLCVAHDNEADSLKNLKSSSYDGTNHGACAFTSLQGFTTVANTKWIDTNVDVNVGIFSGNYHHMWLYQRSITPTTSSDLMSAGWPAILNQNGPAPDQTFTNMNGGVTPIISQDAPVGFIGETYTYPDVTLRINATEAVGTGGAIGGSNRVLVGSRGPGGGTSGANIQCAGWGLGANMSASEFSQLRTLIEAYMDAIGAGVFP